MRIIAGREKGRRLRAVRGQSVRPTSGRARTVLFDILAPRIAGCRFLDLYAGVGAVGLEALSRGAAFAAFVEANEKACRAIRENIESVGVKEQAEVICKRAESGLKLLSARGEKFDIVFLDPPYAAEREAQAAVEYIGGCDLLRERALVVLQHFSKSEVPARVGRLEVTDSRRIGDTCFSFFEQSGRTLGPALRLG